jgi:hypothetical protein
MKLSPNDTKLIADYLGAVGSRLTGPDREETLAGLESHIHEAIEARAEQGPGVVEAVLAEMDPPDQYGDGLDDPGEGQLSKLALWGAVLLPWGLPVLWHVVRLTPAGEGMQMIKFYDSPLYQFFFLPLGVVTMVVATVLGWLSAKRIVRSGGSLFGLPLAALDAVFHPLLVLNLMLFVAWANVMDVMEVAIPSFIVLPVLLLVLWGNVHVYHASLGTMESGKPLARALRVPAIVFVLIFAGLLIWAKRGAADRVTEILEEHRQQQENLEAEIERAEELLNPPENPE